MARKSFRDRTITNVDARGSKETVTSLSEAVVRCIDWLCDQYKLTPNERYIFILILERGLGREWYLQLKDLFFWHEEVQVDNILHDLAQVALSELLDLREYPCAMEL